ncbi:UTP--glucose-1-phosphate uridylyltransferase [Patescibacteria group bacterium]
MKKIRKGVITAAGKGTRFLPAVKTMPKEMLPIVDKPIIQYVVEEMVEAGIEDIIIVTSWDKRAVEDHFDNTFEVEEHLKKQGKLELLKQIQKISSMANFSYVRQKGPYGNGTPCLNVRNLIGDEPFVYAFGDDLVKSRTSFTKQLVEKYESEGGGVILGCQKTPQDQLDRYGVIDLKETTGDKLEAEGIIEKPEPGQEPSDLAAFGRYILEPQIPELLAKQSLGKGNELWLVDAIHEYIKQGGKVYAQPVENGFWYTTGDPLNYMKASLEYAIDREDMNGELKEYIKSLRI